MPIWMMFFISRVEQAIVRFLVALKKKLVKLAMAQKKKKWAKLAMAPISVALLTEPLNATVKNKKVILHNSEELGWLKQDSSESITRAVSGRGVVRGDCSVYTPSGNKLLPKGEVMYKQTLLKLKPGSFGRRPDPELDQDQIGVSISPNKSEVVEAWISGIPCGERGTTIIVSEYDNSVFVLPNLNENGTIDYPSTQYNVYHNINYMDLSYLEGLY
jgi:hypothetical protein